MMEDYQPYQAPLSKLASGGGDGRGVPEEILQELERGRPWVQFLSVLGFIGAFFSVVGGVMVLAAQSYLETSGVSQAEPAMGGMMIIMSLSYFGVGAAYFTASRYMWKYASAISTLTRTRTTEDLRLALSFQASFWKTVGLMVVVMFVGGVVMTMIFAMIAAAGFSELPNQ